MLNPMQQMPVPQVRTPKIPPLPEKLAEQMCTFMCFRGVDLTIWTMGGFGCIGCSFSKLCLFLPTFPGLAILALNDISQLVLQCHEFVYLQHQEF